MWIVLSSILTLIVIFLLLLLARAGGNTQNRIARKVFSGTETHAIIMLNDDFNQMETVVKCFTRIGMPETDAINFMLRVHEEGVAIIWTGSRDDAAQHLQSLRDRGLRCFISEII
jgi:ATP-dependent Clp protease adapter protein ClpS